MRDERAIVAYRSKTCCRNLERYLAPGLPGLYSISRRYLVFQVKSTFDKQVGECSSVGNELRPNPFGLNCVPSLRIWMWRAWVRKHMSCCCGGKSDRKIPHREVG